MHYFIMIRWRRKKIDYERVIYEQNYTERKNHLNASLGKRKKSENISTFQYINKPVFYYPFALKNAKTNKQKK